jgi:hypothetical protein
MVAKVVTFIHVMIADAIYRTTLEIKENIP